MAALLGLEAEEVPVSTVLAAACPAAAASARRCDRMAALLGLEGEQAPAPLVVPAASPAAASSCTRSYPLASCLAPSDGQIGLQILNLLSCCCCD